MTDGGGVGVGGLSSSGSGMGMCWTRIRNSWKSHTSLERSLLLVTCGLVTLMALILPALISAYVNLKSKQDLHLLHISHRSSKDDSFGNIRQIEIILLVSFPFNVFIMTGLDLILYRLLLSLCVNLLPSDTSI